MRKRSEKTPKGSTANLDGMTDPYTCTGNFPDDFAELWKRNCREDSFQPGVKARKHPPDRENEETKYQEEEDDSVAALPQTYNIVDKQVFFQPTIDCEFEGDEAKQSKRLVTKGIHIKGWKIEEPVLSVLKQCVLEKLTTVNLWNTGLTEKTFHMFVEFLCALPAINSVTVEGNPIPDSEPFADLLTKDIAIQHLSLRNNQITDIGAAKIGKALGPPDQPPRELLNLNLAFNRISDDGAKEIAKGLRMNRLLVSLSLASNKISDQGAEEFAHSLNTFCLTHDEIVQRRKLMSERLVLPRDGSGHGSRRGGRLGGSRGGLQIGKVTQRLNSPKRKDNKGKAVEKQTKKQEKGKKEAVRPTSKTPVMETPKQRTPKTKHKLLASDTMSPDLSDQSHPLLSPAIESKDGKIWMPGCNTLICLNLSRNEIGLNGMTCLLQAVKKQRRSIDNVGRPGLLKLSLHKNNVPHDSDTYLEIFQLMRDKKPLNEDVFN